MVNSNLRNKLQWSLRNSYIFIQENTFENVVCEIAAVLSQPQSVKERKRWWMHIPHTCVRKTYDNRPISQFPDCTCSISHNVPFRTEMFTFLFWMEHCGIWNRCILGFVNEVNWQTTITKIKFFIYFIPIDPITKCCISIQIYVINFHPFCVVIEYILLSHCFLHVRELNETQNKIFAILQTFSNAISLIKSFVFWFHFVSMGPMVDKSTLVQIMAITWTNVDQDVLLLSCLLYDRIVPLSRPLFNTPCLQRLFNRKTSCINRTKYQNLNVSLLLLPWSVPNLLKPGVKLRMKM